MFYIKPFFDNSVWTIYLKIIIWQSGNVLANKYREKTVIENLS